MSHIPVEENMWSLNATAGKISRTENNLPLALQALPYQLATPRALSNAYTMSSPALSARLKYLNDSAHLLATTAPQTSAYLMSRCNNLMFDNDLDQTEGHRRHVCGACGNITVLGWTGTRLVEKLKTRKARRIVTSKQDKLGKQRAKAIIYKCELCSRDTRQDINTIAPRSLQAGTKALRVVLDVSTPSSNEETPGKTASSAMSNASSRKRAKVRKLGGLQALLAKNKDTRGRGSGGGFGLDLLDLMKKA